MIVLTPITPSMRAATQSVREFALDAVSTYLWSNHTLTFQAAVGSFHGMPQAPFGSYPHNYLFNLDVPMSSSLADPYYQHLPNGSDIAAPHASLSALLYASGPGTQVAWNQLATRFALVLTNANASVAGDGAVYGIVTPNNYDGVLDAAPGQAPGTGEDFPSPSKAYAAALLAGGVWPLFGVVDCAGQDGCPDYNVGVKAFYEDVVATLGFGQVLDLSAAYSGQDVSSILVDAVASALVLQNRSAPGLLVYDADPLGRVVASDGLYQRTLFIPADLQNSQDSNVEIREFPYPIASLVRTTAVPLGLGCDGIQGSGAVLDECGECDGNNGCFCPFETPIDVCGVCGGDGTSCLGCDGQIYLAPETKPVYDICGVCEGDGTTCVGCDGVVNSGLYPSACGNCGEPAIECTNGSGLHPLGIAGIVLIIVGFFFLLLFLLAFLIGKRSVDHKESKLKKDQLFIEAQQRHKLQK